MMKELLAATTTTLVMQTATAQVPHPSRFTA